MNRRTALLAGALALAVLACAGFLLWQSGHAQAAVTAQIYQYGELVEEVRLDQVTGSYTIPLSGEDGSENLVEVEPGRIRVVSANCPDQVCVQTGQLTRAGESAICLPARVTLRLEGGGDSVDATVY